MTVHETLLMALDGLAPKVGRYPLDEIAETYIAWMEIIARPVTASNRWSRVQHTLQVDLYSQRPLDTLLPIVLHRLRMAGCAVVDWGPETYEKDTRYRHIPITLRLVTDEQNIDDTSEEV